LTTLLGQAIIQKPSEFPDHCCCFSSTSLVLAYVAAAVWRCVSGHWLAAFAMQQPPRGLLLTPISGTTTLPMISSFITFSFLICAAKEHGQQRDLSGMFIDSKMGSQENPHATPYTTVQRELMRTDVER
jgi:hypothetical protein